MSLWKVLLAYYIYKALNMHFTGTVNINFCIYIIIQSSYFWKIRPILLQQQWREWQIGQEVCEN